MATTIDASTAGVGGLITTPDNSGVLNLQSGGSTKVSVTSAGVAVTGLSKGSLPTGSVLQVVQGTYATLVTNSTTTYADSGLTATITPTSATSKILVQIVTNYRVRRLGSYGSGYINLVRSASQILEYIVGSYSTAGTEITATSVANINYLDSPATTSAITYKMQLKSGGNSATMETTEDNNLSTIVLMEIAA
jgi:hypothetical protein